eukprot:3029441-Prymnesium_polylepis.1
MARSRPAHSGACSEAPRRPREAHAQSLAANPPAAAEADLGAAAAARLAPWPTAALPRAWRRCRRRVRADAHQSAC